jgi:hypothetical protein
MIAAEKKAVAKRGPLSVLMGCALALTVLTSAVFAPSASAAPLWTSEIEQAPTNLPSGGRGTIWITPSNAGPTAASSFPTVSTTLPPGVSAGTPEPPFWTCGGSPLVTCTSTVSGLEVAPFSSPNLGGAIFPVALTVDVASGAPEGTFPIEVTVSGGGGATVTETHQVTIGSEQLSFGPKPGAFEAGAFDAAGDDYTQAGGHPYSASARFELNTKFSEFDTSDFGSLRRMVLSEGELKDVVVETPAGFVGDPSVGTKCPDLGLVHNLNCPAESQVGVASISPPLGLLGRARMFGVYNVEPAKNHPAEFAFRSPIGTVLLIPTLRSDGDFGITATVRGITQIDNVWRSTVTLWGVPADPSHDAQRCAAPNLIAKACVGVDEGGQPPPFAAQREPHTSTDPLKPFLSNPTRCSGQPDVTRLHVSNWANPAPFDQFGDPDLTDPAWKSATATSPALTGCDALEFKPTLKARPTTNAADSPTGLEVDLGVPQNEDPDGFATAHLKDTTVTLPDGLVINPSGANGLDGCSIAQVGLTSPVGNDDPVFDKTDPTCPDASKVGSVEVETPLLDDPLKGSVYVAKPHENPFGSLLAIYIVVKGPGLIVKVAGEVTPDPVTGQLKTVVTDNPQVPFEHFKLDFFGGAAASLKTPATCGTYSTTSSLTPWSAPDSGPPAAPSDTYAIAQGPNGSPCASTPGAQPHAPSFDAGSTSPLAGAYSPFVMNLRREDGSQQFSALNVSPPPGLVGKLAGTPACPDSALAAAAARSGKAEQAAPSCPPASDVGSVIAGAGAGPAPYYASGKAYLAGPYKGAPLSMAFVTPAVAGPFDLGTIVVRAALHVNSKTAQISAVSDPLPTILEGIPLDVRSVQLRIDKPQFTLNPTSCDPTAVTGSLLSTLGQSAALQSRFQLAECGRLAFKPRLKLALKGGTKRGSYPALTATLTPRAGDANIASVSVALPGSEFLAQEHIRTICTRVQFAADQCPAAAIYGTATVTTPLLDYPLTGPVYLRSSNNPLPDLVPDLRGPAFQPIKLEAAGRTDSFNEGIRNSFDFVPDAPFTKLVLKMQGGKKSLLRNSTDICARKNRATVKYSAHNGLTHTARPALKAQCGKKARSGKKPRGGR